MLVLTHKVVTETYTDDASAVPAASPTRGKYVHVFPATLTVQIPGTVHRLGTADLLLQVYSAETPARGASAIFTVDSHTFDVVLQFTQPQAGRVILLA